MDFFTLLRGALPIPSWDNYDCFSDTWKHLNSFLGWRILSTLPSKIWHIASLARLVIYCSVSNFNMHKDSLPTAEYERRGGLRYYQLAPQSMSIKVLEGLSCILNPLLHQAPNWESVIENIDIAISFHFHQICPGSLHFHFGPTATEFVFVLSFLREIRK